MKKAIAIIVSLIFVLSVAGLSFAAEEKKPATPAKTEEKKAEKKAPAKVKQVTGEVTAVDAKGNTLTVKGKKAEVSLTTDEKTTVKIGKEKKTLADVMVGDKATVKYAEVDGKNVAKSIAVTPAKKKEEKKEAAPAKKEEKKPAEKK
ncbi:MAG: hypothetical protein OHK0032_00390 [Thermodesulfovibrionales bacterium]